MDAGHAAVAPGVTTDEIDRVIHEATVSRGAYPSPFNYYNFPKSCCTSVNEVTLAASKPCQEALPTQDVSMLSQILVATAFAK